MPNPTQHLAISAAAGGAVWGLTGEFMALPVTVAAGVLVDGDHIPDLVWNHVMDRRPVVIVALHGWEWLGALVIVGAVIGFPWWLTAVLLGYGLHIVVDALFNGSGVRAYSLVFRAKSRFQGSSSVPDQSQADERDHLSRKFPLALTVVMLMRRMLHRPALTPRGEGGRRSGTGLESSVDATRGG